MLQKNLFKNILKILLSAFFIYLLIIKINWTEAISYLKNLSIFYIIFYLFIIFLGILISSYKWKLLADDNGFKEKLSFFLKLYITGAFINNFVPSTIGGDIYRAYQLGKKYGRHPEATATVVDDRITGLLALFIITPIFSVFNLSTVLKSNILILINIIFIFILIIIPFLPKIIQYFFNIIKIKIIPEKILVFIKEIGGFRKNKSLLMKTLFYSILTNLICVGIANFVLFWSLGINIGILDYFSVIFIISIISSIPAGVGLKEWAYILFFGIVGIDISAAAIVAILNRFLQAFINIIALPIYLKEK